MNNSAFPHDDGPLVVHGLTKRELFAAMAMQGLIGDYGTWDVTGNTTCGEVAVKLADALIAALEAK